MNKFKVGDRVRHHLCGGVRNNCKNLDVEGEVKEVTSYHVSVLLNNGELNNYTEGDLESVSVRLTTSETIIVDPKTGGKKGQKLAQLGALDPKAIMAVADVAGFGAQKYDRYNFMKGYAWSLSYDALQRHLHAFWSGVDRDEESELYHLAHAAWHCLALLTFLIRNKGTDDRPPKA